MKSIEAMSWVRFGAFYLGGYHLSLTVLSGINHLYCAVVARQELEKYGQDFEEFLELLLDSWLEVLWGRGAWAMIAFLLYKLADGRIKKMELVER